MEYGSLHTRSHFSFLDGASAPEVLAQHAADLGHSCIVLTDVLGVYGAVRLQRACSNLGIKPIVGADLTIHDITVSIIAINKHGYHQLCSVISKIHQKLIRVHQINPRLLTDCMFIVHGTHSSAAQIHQLYTLLGNSNTYFGIEHDARPWANQRIHRAIRIAYEYNLPVVAAQDVCYASREEYATHDLMVCIREGITVFDPHPLRPVHDRQCLRSYDELHRLIPYEDAFHNLHHILTQCSYDIISDTITPPSAQIPDGTTSSEMLRKLAIHGFHNRYETVESTIRTKAQELLRHELSVIDELQLSDFFLVVHEVVSESVRRGIRCSGRGSAANSIVAYVLNITAVCPVRHNLLFERFLHKGRKGTPDIDVDFDSERRAEIISWMEERFGLDQTAMTATVILYRMRMAIRDAAKAIGWPMDIVNSLSKQVPSWTNHDIENYRDQLASVVGYVPMLDVLLRAVTLLLGHPRHLGQHSGGMVLSSKPLECMTPIQRSANGVAVVQFDKDDIEAMGLIKFDVLGLRMLACISETIELITMSSGEQFDIDNIPLDDSTTFDMIRKGHTLGVFQIESQGQMHLLAKHQPECFDDLVIEVALFRPGPLQGGMVHPYIARRSGKEAIEYAHPDLEPILRDTLGIVLFQEQVLEIAHRFAGMSLDEADDFRSLVSKNRDRALMTAMKDRFIQGALSRGISKSIAQNVYDTVSHFVGYGFCRSHAAAFAMIVYQSAWLKAHYPAAYLAAFMQHRPGMYNLMTLEEEARRFGSAVLMPDIHRSHIRYTIEATSASSWAIRKPLTSIRGVSDDIARTIILERAQSQFRNVEDVTLRLRSISRDVLEMIALSGALSCLEPDARRAMWIIGVVRQRMDTEHHNSLFTPTYIHDAEIPSLPSFLAQERLAYDYITHGAARIHPMTLFRRMMNSLEIRSIETINRFSTDGAITVCTAGIVMLRQAPPTAHGVLFVTIEDETGFLQCVVPPRVRERYTSELHSSALMLKGKVTGTGSWRSLVVTEVFILTNVIGGYHGHLSYAGGRDTLEVGNVVSFAQ
ncbi:MAG: DNA polymerase III subunit alpha [Ignavibacteria bacterium]|nr:DNA polymerase III subunit alpha [Ignavibacteria bacterium]